MDYARPALAEALAAQYVAGTLRGPARRRFEALLPSHPALQAAVAAWQERLMPLTASLEPQPAPPAVWRGIQARLWPEAPDATAARATAFDSWRRLAFWRGAAGFASVAALTLAVLLAGPRDAPAPIVVVLDSTPAAASAVAGSGGFVASVSADGRALVARPLQALALDTGRVLELWSVPPEGQGGPVSLGLVRADGATVIRRDKLPRELLKGGTAALAVSVEPPGGSTTGAPTGPVVFAGRLQL